MPVIAVASPSYLARHGAPRSRADLRRHRCILGIARAGLPQTQWPAAGGGRFHVEGSFFSNDLMARCEAALHGLGVTLLPQFLARPHLDAGALVRVLPGAIEGESRLAIVHLERELVPPQVRAFVEAVAAWAPEELGPLLGGPRRGRGAKK
jgi:DNA-binding transcriptional LysR family regulator